MASPHNASDVGEYIKVTMDNVHGFVRRCVVAAGGSTHEGSTLAEVLVAADYRGHFSHGLRRLPVYVHDIKEGKTRINQEPQVIKQTAATAYVEGNDLLGAVVGKFCMDLAIEKAETTGVGWVVAKGSTHFGIAGWYTLQATSKGFLGFTFSNADAFVWPPRAAQPAYGTNPMSMAAPGIDGDDFVLDMATSTVSVGKAEIKHQEKKHCPPGWVCDSEGHPSNDPEVVLNQTGGMMPLGGSEETGGYKGYALGVMVEVLTGVLAAANTALEVPPFWSSSCDRVANLGQCFIALNPEVFAPGFPDRLSTLLGTLRSLKRVEQDVGVLVAGDPERQHMKKCDGLGAIPYLCGIVADMDNLATEFGVPPLERL